MFELALGVNDLSVDYLEKKLPTFRESIIKLDGIFNVHKKGDYVYFLIASENAEKDIKEIILQFICDCIREDLKAKYIKSNFTLNCEDDLKKNMLIEALINFDRMSDDKYIRNRIRFNDEFHIKSFYMFKLGELQNKWSELLRVTNQSDNSILIDEIYMEVLRYLLDGIDMVDYSVVEGENNKFSVSNSKFNTEIKLDTISNLMGFLIKYNPQKVIVKNIDNNTLRLLTQVFGKSRIKQG